MAEASLIAAFIGGLLSLLSPCSALLLPAFFAYSFGGRRLAGRTAVFYAGLCATLVPLGMGISAVSALFYGHRSLLVTIAGTAIIVLGIAVFFGRGFDIESYGSAGGSGIFGRLRDLSRGDSPGAVFALGAVYGFAGFCSGPILGVILTVAAASGGAATGAVLLATYALGMAAPLFVLALLWERLDLSGRGILRGKAFSVAGLSLHSTNVVSGLLFVVLGVVFIAYEGTSALGGLYGALGTEDVALAAQERVADAVGNVPSWAVVLPAAALAALLLVRWHLGRAENDEPDPGKK